MTTSTPLRLDHELHGPESGPVLVLLHAFPVTRDLWRPVARRLPEVRSVLIDLPGLGLSPDPGDLEPDLATSAAGVVAVLDELGIGAATVAGVSMGGYVTLALLRDHPERVLGAGLVDTKATADTDEARATRLRMADAVLGDAGRRALAPLAETLIGETSRESRPDVVRTLAGWLDTTSLMGVAWSQRAMAARPDTSEALAGARVPVAVVVGAEDRLIPPSEARGLADLAEDATFTVVPDAGHLAPIEAPDDVAAALRGLLERVARR